MAKSNDFDSELEAAKPWEDEAMEQMRLIGCRVCVNPFKQKGRSDDGFDFMALQDGELWLCNAKHLDRYACDGKIVVHMDKGAVYTWLWMEDKHTFDRNLFKADLFVMGFHTEELQPLEFWGLSSTVGKKAMPAFDKRPGKGWVQKYSVHRNRVKILPIRRDDGTSPGG